MKTDDEVFLNNCMYLDSVKLFRGKIYTYINMQCISANSLSFNLAQFSVSSKTLPYSRFDSCDYYLQNVELFLFGLFDRINSDIRSVVGMALLTITE